MKKVVIMVICMFFSLLSFAENNIEGVWRYQNKNETYFFKIKGDEVFFLNRIEGSNLTDLNFKGKIIEKEDEKFIELTEAFKVFEWVEIEPMRYSLDISQKKFLINNLEYKKTYLSDITKQKSNIKKKISLKQMQVEKQKNDFELIINLIRIMLALLGFNLFWSFVLGRSPIFKSSKY